MARAAAAALLLVALLTLLTVASPASAQLTGAPANGEADRIAWHEKIFKAVKNAGLLG